MGGVPGTEPAEVVVIGAGVSGVHAATIAMGMGAQVTVFDLDITKLRAVDARFGGRIHTRYSTALALQEAVVRADLVIGAVLVPGAKAPVVVPNSLVAQMKPGSVLVDIAIDQGGCFEGSRATTHDAPTFRVHESLYYCVANMPGAVPHTSTRALSNATLPYITRIADAGWEAAASADPALAKGLNVRAGVVVNEGVRAAFAL